MNYLNKQAAKDWRKHYKANKPRLQKMMKEKLGANLDEWLLHMKKHGSTIYG